MVEDKNIRVIVRNRKARYDYRIVDTYEAGMELQGSEVKSIRDGKVSLSDAYAVIENSGVILKNLHISAYKMAMENHDPLRPRRLLLHKREIYKLKIQVEQRGMTLIPLSIYFKGNRAKIELAVAEGRKKYDKRQDKAQKEADRRIKKALKREY